MTLDQFTEIGIPSPEIARYALTAIEIVVLIALDSRRFVRGDRSVSLVTAAGRRWT